MDNEVDVKQDARWRAVRTFVQGLAFDIIAALIVILLPIVSQAQTWDDFDTKALLFLVFKTVVMTVFSYVSRAKGLGQKTLG